MAETKPTDRFLGSFWDDVGKRLGGVFAGALLLLVGAGTVYVTAGWPTALRAAATALTLLGTVVVLAACIALTERIASYWRRRRDAKAAQVETERNAPKLTLSYDKGASVAEILVTVRNDGGPAQVRAYAQLVSVNVDRDANKPTKREYELGWWGKPGVAVVTLGRGESATFDLAECRQADLGDGPRRSLILGGAGVGTDPTTEEWIVNSWLWNTVENEKPIRVVVTVRLVSDPALAEPCEQEFTLMTRPPYGNIYVE